MIHAAMPTALDAAAVVIAIDRTAGGLYGKKMPVAAAA